jgi:hypothetical protein
MKKPQIQDSTQTPPFGTPWSKTEQFFDDHEITLWRDLSHQQFNERILSR